MDEDLFRQLPDESILEITVFLPFSDLLAFLSCSKRLWNLHAKLETSRRFTLIRTAIDMIENLKRFELARNIHVTNNALEQLAFWNEEELLDCLLKKLRRHWKSYKWALFHVVYGAKRGNCTKIFEIYDEELTYNGLSHMAGRYLMQVAATHRDMKYLEKCPQVDWNFPLYAAAQLGQLDLVELCIERGANYFSAAMGSAAEGGHLELVKYFASKGACDWNDVLESASERGHKHIVEYLIEQGADDWNEGLNEAAAGGHLDLARFFLEKGATDLERAIETAERLECAEMVSMLKEYRQSNSTS